MIVKVIYFLNLSYIDWTQVFTLSGFTELPQNVTQMNVTENVSAAMQFFLNGSFSTIGQIIMCYTQLMIIVGLCLDNGKSLSSKFYKTKVMQFLGRISMSLYLLHEPLIYYIRYVPDSKN